MRTEPVECVVVGGSVAGLSAALVLGRARRSTVVIDAGAPVNRTVDHSHGFLTRDGTPPAELVALGRDQLRPYGVGVQQGTVERVERSGANLILSTADGGTRAAQRVVLATGMRFDLPAVPGLAETWGKGSANCPYCHGWEARDRHIGVLAVDAERARHLALLLLQWSADVVLYGNGVDMGDIAGLLAAGAVHQPGRVAAVDGLDGAVRAVRLDDDTTHACDALFVATEPTTDTSLLRSLGGEVGDDGWPVSSPSGRTSVDGVWVAGNAMNPTLTLIESAASGARAAMDVNADLTLSRHTPGP